MFEEGSSRAAYVARALEGPSLHGTSGGSRSLEPLPWSPLEAIAAPYGGATRLRVAVPMAVAASPYAHGGVSADGVGGS